jgi:hypothetical protein
MTKPIARDSMYRKRVFDADIIELCVRWSTSRSGATVASRRRKRSFAKRLPQRTLVCREK